MMFRIDIMLRFKCKARNHQNMYFLKFGLCEKFIYFKQNGLTKMGWKKWHEKGHNHACKISRKAQA